MNLFYRSEGTGIPVIILHGLYGSSDNWMTIARKLAKHDLQIITLDHRNHGNSPHTPEHSYEDMITDLAWLLNDLGIEKAHIVGHSMGGKVAIGFAADYPEKILSLTIADIIPLNYLEKPASAIQYDFHKKILDTLYHLDIKRAKSRKEVEKELMKDIPELHIRKFILKNIRKSSDQSFEWKINVVALRENLDEIISGVDYREYEDRIPILTYPVQLIRGGLSGYCPDDKLNIVKEMYPEIIINTMEDATHFLHAEKPDEFTNLLLEFIQTVR